jgi:hypothetical protein
LIPPAVPGIQKIKLSGRTQASMSQSPFTGSQQIFEWPAEWWELQAALPPCTRANAEAWNAFLLALRGQSGTFYFGDTAALVPRGTMANFVNLLLYTESLDNTSHWIGQGGGVAAPTVTANAVLDPNSNLTAEQISFPATGVGQFSQLLQAVIGNPLVRNRNVCFSIFLKASAPTTIDLAITDNPFSGTSSFQQTVSVTTSWTRFNVSFLMSATGSPGAQVAIQNPPSQGAKTIHAWGAQFEKGTSPSTYSGTINQGPSANGAGQTGKTFDINAVPPSQVVFKAGDYIQVGTGAAQRFHKVLTDTTSSGSSTATVDIFPRLRESPADGDPIRWMDARGTFRLSANLRGWDIDEALVYGLQFSAIEAI